MLTHFSTIFLIAWPMRLMGCVQLVFALLSYTIFDDHEEADFLIPSISLLILSFILVHLERGFSTVRVSFRDALLFAVITWITMGISGAIPIYYITKISFTDAVFESVSALTTTGATVLSGLDEMPLTFLMYRQFLQWLGGLGIVIFVVAVLPMLNVGGMRLLKAETPGPIKDDKLSPRMTNTARYLWLVYFALTFACALAYFLAGMSVYDAIAHSLTTVSTGGFSTHDASMGYFNSHTMMFLCDIFMLAGAINFAIHFRAWEARHLIDYWRDEETRTFILIVLALTVFVAILLYGHQTYDTFLVSLSQACFHIISFITSTGFGAGNFSEWPLVIACTLVIAGYLGGCAGSTAGGNKIIRNILTVKIIGLEMKRLMHPYGVFHIKYQGHFVEPSIISATMTFMAVAAVSSVVIAMSLMITGLDFWSAFTAVAACLNVLGPAFGSLGSNFQPVSDAGTWILSATMILGRLEYFTVFALFSPYFWKR